jgi:hypothetical protein
MILTAIILFPIQIGNLASLMSKQKHPSHREFKGYDHVIVIAHDPNTIIPFLKEFHHPDRKINPIKYIVSSPFSPFQYLFTRTF